MKIIYVCLTLVWNKNHCVLALPLCVLIEQIEDLRRRCTTGADFGVIGAKIGWQQNFMKQVNRPISLVRGKGFCIVLCLNSRRFACVYILYTYIESYMSAAGRPGEFPEMCF